MRLRFLILLAASCGTRTDLGGHAQTDASSQTDAPPATTYAGVVLNACGPADGLEIDIFLAPPNAPAPSCANPSVVEGGVRIAIWNSPVDVPGDYVIGDGSFPSGSSATYCPGGKQTCPDALHGTLTVKSLTPTTMSGSFSFVLPDQTTITGNFSQIGRCNNSTMCG